MSRYCFTANNATDTTLRDLQKFFKDIADDVTLDGNMACVQTGIENVPALVEQMSIVGDVLNIETTTPLYIPKWTDITQVGPFYPDAYDKYIPISGDLIDKRNNKRYKLNPSEEEIATLYASRLLGNKYVDPVLNENFWMDFQEFLRPGHPFTDFNQIDWTDMIEKLKRKPQAKPEDLKARKGKYGHVFIDGKQEFLDTYSVPPTALFFGGVDNPLRGKIKFGIVPSDVTLNLSPGIPTPTTGSKREYAPGTNWAAKWADPLTGEIHTNNIIFQPPEIPEESDIESEYETSSSESEESEVDYGEGEEDEEEDEEDEEDKGDRGDKEEEEPQEPGEIRGGAGIKPYIYRKRTKFEKVVLSPEELVNLTDLTAEEDLLPYSYILSKLDQWEILERACKSGFALVSNLPKVSNVVLKEFADMVSYGATHVLHFTSEDDPVLLKINAILEYAKQRDV